MPEVAQRLAWRLALHRFQVVIKQLVERHALKFPIRDIEILDEFLLFSVCSRSVGRFEALFLDFPIPLCKGEIGAVRVAFQIGSDRL